MCKRFHSAPHPDIQRLFSVSINRLQEFERSLAFGTVVDLRLRFLQLTLMHVWFLIKLS